MATLREVTSALRAKCQYEVVSAEEKESQVRLVGRIKEGQTTTPMKNWLLLLHHLLSNQGAAWKVDASKYYFLSGGRLVFGWRLLFQGAGIASQYGEIAAVIGSAPFDNSVEVTSVRLGGVDADRNAGGVGRRGASPIDKAVVGPMALSARMRGG